MSLIFLNLISHPNFGFAEMYRHIATYKLPLALVTQPAIKLTIKTAEQDH